MGQDGGDPLIRAVGVGKTYGEGENQVHALREIDLILEGGRIYGLLGPNGAGKTTLLRTLATLLRPTRGDAWIMGLHSVEEARAVRSRIGYLSASTGVYPRLTPEEFLRYFGRLHGMDSGRIEARLQELLGTLGIDAYRRRMIGKLSTGMKQKVSIARAFFHDPPILILDEPTNGLDVMVRQSLLDRLRESVHPGRLILLSTHDLPEAEEICDSFIFIDSGRIVARGGREELPGAGRESLKEAFFEAMRRSGTMTDAS